MSDALRAALEDLRIMVRGDDDAAPLWDELPVEWTDRVTELLDGPAALASDAGSAVASELRAALDELNDAIGKRTMRVTLALDRVRTLASDAGRSVGALAEPPPEYLDLRAWVAAVGDTEVARTVTAMLDQYAALAAGEGCAYCRNPEAGLDHWG